MSGDTIRSFKGEILWAPEALELSMNWCGHACSYCYANARKPNRKADLKATMGLLANFRERNSQEAKLLQMGYPLNVSNHVDVFAGTNAAQFEPIWEVCVSQGVPIVFQTRGAHKPQQKILDRVIAETPKSVWYVSIPMWDDKIRQQVEPQAPSIPYRLELIEQIKAAGHHVVVGVNPTCIEWLPEFEPLFDRCKELGVWGLWFSALYFGRTFGEQLTPQQVERITPELIKRCGVKGSAIDHQHILQAMEYAESIGLEAYYHRADRPGRVFDVWLDAYPRVMPMLQELINVLHSQRDKIGDDGYLVVTKEEAIKSMQLLPEDLDYGPFFHCDVKQYRISQGLPQGASLPSLGVNGFWDLTWNNEFFSNKLGFLNISSLAYAAVIDGDQITPIEDDHGDRVMVYRPDGWKYRYAHTPELAA